MKKFLFYRALIGSLFLTGLLLFNTSCVEGLKSEIDELTAANEALQLELDANGTTLTELEAQKAELESLKAAIEEQKSTLTDQNADLEAQIADLNTLISKLETMIGNKLVERYFDHMLGIDNFTAYHWQHLYNEDLQLFSSIYTRVNAWDLDEYDILSGDTSMPARSVFSHTYEDGVLVKSESDRMVVNWSWENGKVSEIRKQDADHDEYTIFTIDTEKSVIEKREEYSLAGELHYVSTYSYNEDNLISRIESKGSSDGSIYVDTYEYDSFFNIVEYRDSSGTELDRIVRNTFNEEGNIVKFIYNDLDYEKDSVIVTYNGDGSWEVFHSKDYVSESSNDRIEKRHYDADRNNTYYYYNDGNNIQEAEYEYADGEVTKEIIYRYSQSVTGEWYVSSKNTESYLRDSEGVITTQEFRYEFFDENGVFTSGSSYAYKNIVWLNEYSMLFYSQERYDFNTGELSQKYDIERVEKGGWIYTWREIHYYVTNGVAQYISYSSEITEFFTEAPYAPKTKVEKYFDADGTELDSNKYVNDSNDPFSWNWVLQ